MCEERWLDMLMSPLYQENLVAFVVMKLTALKSGMLKGRAAEMHFTCMCICFICAGVTLFVWLSLIWWISEVFYQNMSM